MIRGKKIENNILNKLETWSQSRTVKWTELKPVVPINENRIFRRSFLSVIRVVAAMTKIYFIEGDSFRAKCLFHFFFIFYHSRFERYHQNGETSVHETIGKIEILSPFFFLVEIFVFSTSSNKRSLNVTTRKPHSVDFHASESNFSNTFSHEQRILVNG